MPGKIEDIEKLKLLEQIDNTLQDGAEAFNNSPIAKKIAAVRLKKSEVKAKRDQVDKVFVRARNSVDEVGATDSQLAADQDKIQNEIKTTQGDYRKVEAATNKLNELTLKRQKVDAQLEQLEANFNKIKQLKEKIDASIEKLSLQEDDLQKQLETSNVQLKLDMDKASLDKKKIEAEISREAIELYKKSRNIVGRIVIAHNEGGLCSVCRAKFSGAHLSKFDKEAPISTCPHCLRLIVLEKN